MTTKRWTAVVATAAVVIALGGCAGTMSGDAMMQNDMKHGKGMTETDKGMMQTDTPTMDKDKGGKSSGY